MDTVEKLRARQNRLARRERELHSRLVSTRDALDRLAGRLDAAAVRTARPPMMMTATRAGGLGNVIRLLRSRAPR